MHYSESVSQVSVLESSHSSVADAYWVVHCQKSMFLNSNLETYVFKRDASSSRIVLNPRTHRISNLASMFALRVARSSSDMPRNLPRSKLYRTDPFESLCRVMDTILNPCLLIRSTWPDSGTLFIIQISLSQRILHATSPIVQ